MTRVIFQLRFFKKEIARLIAKRKLAADDFEELKKFLVNYPDMGDVIPATGGLRKIRLKSVSKGKRGGFRICYLDDPFKDEIYLIAIYAKNEKEDITAQEKKDLQAIARLIRER